MKKIKNIEFLRIVGCIAIVMLHFFAHYLGNKYGNIPIYHHLKQMTGNGQKAVDLFFILSGFFFFVTFKKEISIWNFLKKKLVRLYPVLIFVILITFLLSLFSYTKFSLYESIFYLFSLNGTLLSLNIGYIDVYWYVSVMIWELLLYFYLLKYYELKNINLFAYISVFLSYGILIHITNGKIYSNIQTYDYIYQISTLRGLGGISLGYIIGFWYKNNIEDIKNYILTMKQKIVYTLLEFICLFFIINNLFLRNIKFRNDTIFIIVFGCMIFLFALNKGFISKIFNKDIFVQLSKYTYSIYMTHTTIVKPILINTLWKYTNIIVSHPYINIVIIFISTIVFGVITYHFVEEPCAKMLKEKYCKQY